MAKARTLLQHGEERARELAEGHPAWTTATGLVVRGYISKIDQSVQPYGLVVPPSYSPNAPHRWRLDAWFHGRSETLSQVNFLADRERSVGEFAPRDTIVLHLYGRYCNASKFAGEVDLFEALDAVKRQYPIDENRILDRGFSMGGASAWHIGAHYAGLWAAVAPGAGFSESEQYLKLKLTGPGAVPEWEQKLFHLYDATDYAVNLYNTSTIAYNGEIDPQKQAADMMEHAMAEEGLRLIRIVGPQTAHKYHPDSKVEMARMLDAIAEARPRSLSAQDPLHHLDPGIQPHEVGDCGWPGAALGARARELPRSRATAASTWKHRNVTAFTLEMGPGGCPLDLARKPVVAIDGQKLSAPGPMSDRSWNMHFRKNRQPVERCRTRRRRRTCTSAMACKAPSTTRSWIVSSSSRLRARRMAPAIAGWVASEEKRAISEWRRQFRGDAQVRDDQDVTDADIASSNLVLWGDPGSNRLLARIADRLPIKWTADGIAAHGARYPATDAPILVYPNPLNPKKYVVLNSGFTFREADYASNAMQTPKLPDFAIVDTTTPAGTKWPGKIVQAGFFNEEWQW